jgi:hypothetical protein
MIYIYNNNKTNKMKLIYSNKFRYKQTKYKIPI